MKHFRPLRLERLEPRYALAAGDLVESFGVGGKVVTEFPFARGSYDEPARLAKTNDGKFVVVGETNTGHGRTFAIARLLADGSRDVSFGENGVVLSPLGFIDEYATSVAVQTDGRIVVAGFVRKVDSNFDFLVARYSIEGTLDESFGQGGFVTTQLGVFHSLAHDLLIQPDGKIVVVGSGSFGNAHDFSVVRYLVDGSLDESFGDDGIAHLDFGGPNDVPDAIAIDSAGRLVIVGSTTPFTGGGNAAIARLLPDGSPDLAFNVDGKVIVDFPSAATSNTRRFGLALQSDDKILVSGQVELAEEIGVKLVRLAFDGAFDGTFGVEGEVFEMGWTPSEDLTRLLVDDSGRILVGGRQGQDSSSSQMVLFRYTSDGQRDESFGSSGIAISDFVANSFEQPVDILLHPDGGYAVMLDAFFEETSSDFAVARFDHSGERMQAFGDDGLATLNVSMIYSESVLNDLAVLPDQGLLAIGTQFRAADFGRVALLRHLPNGELDANFGVAGKTELAVSSFHLEGVQALPQFDGDAFVVGNSGPRGFVTRIRADGSVDPDFNGGELLTVMVQSSRTTIAAATSSGGGLYVVGNLPSSNEAYVQRLRADGTADSSFGTAGLVVLGADIRLQATALAKQRDGKLLVVGQSFPASFGGWGVATVVRLRIDGTPDPTFGVNGIAFVDYGFTFVYPREIAVLRDGGLLVTGYLSSIAHSSFVTKLNSGGMLDASFGNAGRVVTDIAVSERSESLAVLDDGRFFVAGSAVFNENRDLAIVGYLPNGTLDSDFGDGGVFTTNFAAYSDEASALRVLPSGDLIVGGVTTTGKAKAFAIARIEGHGDAQFPHHNAANPANVDDDPDGYILAADAIIIIDALNQFGPHMLLPPNPNAPPTHYLDTSRDGWITAADAVIVIDYLNANSGEDGEGEAIAAGSEARFAALLSPLDRVAQQRVHQTPPADALPVSRSFTQDAYARPVVSAVRPPVAEEPVRIEALLSPQRVEETDEWKDWLEDLLQNQKLGNWNG